MSRDALPAHGPPSVGLPARCIMLVMSGPVERRWNRLPPLRWWWVIVAATLVVFLGVGAGWWLWSQSNGLAGAELVKAHGDAVRTGLTAAAGTGAALALLLAVRRQRSAELALELQADDLAQKEQIATANAHDAAERRITDLYTKAVEQLGSEKAPVRLGGLYALERLAQDHVEQRQTIVNVLCAYLRMPYTPNTRQTARHVPDLPDVYESSLNFSPSTDEPDRAEFERREQEGQVRQTAQRILASHLRPMRDRAGEPSSPKFWPDIDIDVTGAHLVDFSLNDCEVDALSCNDTTFSGESTFRGLVCNMAFFGGAKFIGGPTSDTFITDFRGAKFGFDAWFSYSQFAGTPFYSAVQFGREGSFKGAIFNNGARFDGASFEKEVDFTDAWVRSNSNGERSWPDGWAESLHTETVGKPSSENISQWHRLVPR